MDYILKPLQSVPRCPEHNSGVKHPEYQDRITSVSHLYEKYRTGKIEDMPSTSLPQMPDDDRSDDEMLNDLFVLGLGKDELDIMNRYKEVRDKLEEEFAQFKLSKEKEKKYKAALEILDNPASSSKEKFQAYQELEALRQSARAN